MSTLMTPLIYPLPVVPMLGKGLILIDRYDANGQLTGLYPMGNATKLISEPKDDIAEQYSSMNKSASLAATALKKRQLKVSITGTDFKADVQALVQMSKGTTKNTVPIATKTNTPLTSATAIIAGRYFQTQDMNIDPATVVIKQGATPLALGADYKISDPVQGLIYFPGNTGALPLTATTADYHTLAGVFQQVAGMVESVITAKLLFSPDPTDGQQIQRQIWRVNFSPTGGTDLISDDYANWQLEGLVLDDSANHPASPFYLDTYLGLASSN